MIQAISNRHRVCQVDGNLVTDMGGEKVMLSIKNGKYYNLGEVGGQIWDHMENLITIPELITRLVEQYDIEKNECEKQVIPFLDHLVAEGLIHSEI